MSQIKASVTHAAFTFKPNLTSIDVFFFWVFLFRFECTMTIVQAAKVSSKSLHFSISTPIFYVNAGDRGSTILFDCAL